MIGATTAAILIIYMSLFASFQDTIILLIVVSFILLTHSFLVKKIETLYPISDFVLRRINRSVLYLCIVFILGIISAFFLNSDFYQGSDSEEFDTAELLGTTSTIIATILTISFSISIFAVQHSSGNYTPGILKFYIKNINIWIIFSLFSISTIICLFGLVSTLPHFMYISIFLSAFSFLLLAYHFYNTSRFTNPLQLIDVIEKEIVSLLYSISNRTKKISITERMTGNLSPKSNILLEKNSNSFSSISSYMSQIIDLILKSITKREIETAEAGLHSFTSIVKVYLSITGSFYLNQEFIFSIYEKIEVITPVALDSGDKFLLGEIIKTYREIGVMKSNVRTSPQVYSIEGPIITRSIYHIQELSKKALVKDLVDTSSQSVDAIMQIGISALQNRKGHVLSFEYIREISDRAYESNSHWSLHLQIHKSLCRLFYIYVGTKPSKNEIPSIKVILTEVFSKCFSNYSNYEAHNLLFPFINDLPSENNYNCVSIVNRIFFTMESEEDFTINPHKQSYAIDLIENVLRIIFAVTIEASKVNFHLVVIYSIKSIYVILSRIINYGDQKFQDKAELNVGISLDAFLTIYKNLLQDNEEVKLVVENEASNYITLLALECIKANRTLLAIRALRVLSKNSQYCYKERRCGNWFNQATYIHIINKDIFYL